MIAIALTFPAGRLHATPWGRHVNEGTPEWPPSPWRLLRGLVATWKRKLDDQLKIEDVRPVLQALAAPPQFALPPATAAHTRHYMPLRFPDQGDRTKVFDTFVVVERKAKLVAIWPDGELHEPQRRTLGLLLENLGFLGRAESWCDGTLLNDEDARKYNPDCLPLGPRGVAPGQEIVRVLCAEPDKAFGNEFTPKVKSVSGQGRQKRVDQLPLYDPDWHLCLETAELHDKRWSDPPGSRWIRYVREANCFAGNPGPVRPAIARPGPKLQVARFALDSAVLPLLQETLPVAETARSALMSLFGKFWPTDDGASGRSEVFSGKSAQGVFLKGHGHAYFLPTDEDGDGRLDHLTVYASDGFGPKELKALDKLRHLRRIGETAPLQILLLGLGRAGEFASGPLGVSKEWVSATPFLVTRHPKHRGRKKDAPEVQHSPLAFVQSVLVEELQRLQSRGGLKSIATVLPQQQDGVFRIDPGSWSQHATGAPLRPIQFKRFRQKRSDDGGRRPSGVFRLVFDTAVRGPISLGHSAHFGMGLFLPATD